MYATDYDDLTAFLGEWGPFQKLITLLLCVSVVPNPFPGLSIVFIAATPPHHCVIPTNVNISAEWRNYSIPMEDQNGVMRYSKCSRYKLDVIKLLSDNGYLPGVDVNVTEIEKEECKDGWQYDRDVYASTIVTEWDLVCSDAWKVPMTTSVYFFGVLFGSIISGQLSDRFGRKIILFGTMGVQTLFTFFQIFSTSWVMFSALYFLVGLGQISNFVAAYVLGIETLSPHTRIMFSTLAICIFFAFGYMTIPLAAFFIRDWRMLVLALAVPGLFYFPVWRWVPESPRWLLSQGRVEEAEAILRRAARKNRVTAPEIIFQPLQVQTGTENVKRHNICDLVKSSNIRWITIILSFVWIVVTIGYYALSLNTSSLYGDPFLNCFFSAAAEVPAYIISWPLFRSCSRRMCHSSMLFLGGAVLLLTQLIPRNLSSVAIGLEMTGKFGITVAFTIVCAYTAELYPTVLRNTAVGTCSMVARVGTISAPYFLYLGTYYKSLPYILMGTLSVLGGLLSLLLPETYGKPLPETIKDMPTMLRCKKRRTSHNGTRDITAADSSSVL